jgi:hypothetical protein
MSAELAAIGYAKRLLSYLLCMKALLTVMQMHFHVSYSPYNLCFIFIVYRIVRCFKVYALP